MRRSRWLNGGLALTVVGLAVGAVVLTGDSSDSTTSTETVSTAKEGIVLSSVSATGSIEAPDSLGVNFQQSGEIEQIPVSVGQQVTAGTVLATIKDTGQQSALDSAIAQLASAEAQLAAKRRGLTKTERAQDQASLDQSQASVDNASVALDHARASADADAAKLQLQVDQAVASADAARASAAQNSDKYDLQVEQAEAQVSDAADDADQAQAEVDDATDVLRSAQDSYDPDASSSESTSDVINRYRLDQLDCQANSSTSGYHTDDGVDCSQIANLLSLAQNVSSAESSADQADTSYDTAVRSLDTAKQNRDSGLLSDQQQIDNADRSVDTAKENQTTGLQQDQQQVETSEGSLRSAEEGLASTKASNAVKEAPAKAEDLAQASATVASAKNNVETAQRNVDDKVLTAPVDGTVASISGTVGGYSSGGSSASSSSSSSDSSSSTTTGFVVLTDLNIVDVKVGFTETDAAKVRVGARATITIDAIGTDETAGTVLSLDLDKTLVNNVVTYYAKVGFDQVPGAAKPGMTASVSVVLDKREDVVTLPTSAVPTQGTTATLTVRDAAGKDTQKSVTIGLRGDSAVEITSGLQAGDKVVTSSTASGGAGGFTPPGGGGIGGGIGGGGP